MGSLLSTLLLVVNNDTEVRPAQHSVTVTTSSYHYITDSSEF